MRRVTLTFSDHDYEALVASSMVSLRTPQNEALYAVRRHAIQSVQYLPEQTKDSLILEAKEVIAKLGVQIKMHEYEVARIKKEADQNLSAARSTIQSRDETIAKLQNSIKERASKTEERIKQRAMILAVQIREGDVPWPGPSVVDTMFADDPIE